MKIAFICPRSTFFSKSTSFSDFLLNSKELASYRDNWSGNATGLLILAALTPEKYEIEFIDEKVKEVDFTEKYSIVCITGMTQQITRAYQIADKFRKKNIKVVIGGIHPTVLPEEAKKHADSVIIGEAEYSWPEFLSDFGRNRIKDFYKSEHSVNLADSPVPRYDLIDKKSTKIIWVQTTRGCPHDCYFCAASKIFGSKYRNKSVNQVVDEINFIHDIFGKVKIGFGDDNMFGNKKKAKDLLEKLLPLKLRWISSGADISVAEDDELLELIYKSGGIFILIGLESVSQDSLNKIDKGNWKFNQWKNYEKNIEKIQSFGIGVFGSFILGLDGTDASIFEDTYNFIIKNKLYAANFGILTPFPGTRLRKMLVDEGRILNTDWENYTGWDVNYIPKNFTIKQLENGLHEIYKRIYNKDVLNPILTHFKEIHKKNLPEMK